MGLNANTSAKRSSRDLTEGNIALQLLSVAFPILIGQLLQSLYNSVDSLVVVNVMGLVVLRQLYLIVATRLSDDIRLVFVSMPVGWVFTVLLSVVAFWVLVFKKHPPTADETSLSRHHKETE